MDSIVAWAVSFMITWAPPGKSKLKDAVESPEACQARYAEIAAVAAQVAYDPTLKPLFGGKRGRASTMSLLLSIAYHESGFRRDVDLGVGKLARGSGTDSCLLQIRVGTGRTAEGWSHEDLVGDRMKCFRAGYALIKRSFGACRRLPILDRLGAYARGRCMENEPLEDAAAITAVQTAMVPSQ
jgi:hypothetical protein